MSEGLAAARAIVSRHRDAAEQARRFHVDRGPRLGNVEALIAACKKGWLESIILEIDALAPSPPQGEP